MSYDQIIVSKRCLVHNFPGSSCVEVLFHESKGSEKQLTSYKQSVEGIN